MSLLKKLVSAARNLLFGAIAMLVLLVLLYVLFFYTPLDRIMTPIGYATGLDRVALWLRDFLDTL